MPDEPMDTTAQSDAAGQPDSETQATAAPAAGPQKEPTITIPVQHMGDYGQDYYKALSDAKRGREFMAAGVEPLMTELKRLNLTPAEFAQYLKVSEGTSQVGAQQPDAGLGGNGQQDQPVTLDAIDKLIERRFESQRDQMTVEAAVQAEQAFGEQVLLEAGIKRNNDGTPTFMMKQTWPIWHSSVNQAMAADIPRWYPADQRDEALRQPASPQVLAKAKEIFKQTLTDLRNEFVSDASTRQQEIPGATNAGGPAGSPPKKPYDEMSWAERKEDIMGRVKATVG